MASVEFQKASCECRARKGKWRVVSYAFKKASVEIEKNRVEWRASSSKRRAGKGEYRVSTSDRWWRVQNGACQIGKASRSISEQRVKRRVSSSIMRVASVEFEKASVELE